MKKNCFYSLFLAASVITFPTLQHVSAQTENHTTQLAQIKEAKVEPGVFGTTMKSVSATDVRTLNMEQAQLIPLAGKPRLKITLEGVILFHYEYGVLTREYGAMRSGIYIYDRHGRFDRLDYSDGFTVFATYDQDDQLVGLGSSKGDFVKFAYQEKKLVPNRSPTVEAKEFHTALAILSTQSKKQLVGSPQAWSSVSIAGESCTIADTAISGLVPPSWTVRSQEGVPLANSEVPTAPDGTPIVTVEGTRDGPSGVDFIPIGGTGGGGGSGGPKQPPKPEYPPDTFTEDYPPFDLSPAKCKDWCMRSDSVSHGVCQLIKLPSRRVLCHERINCFTANCLRSCDTGDWRWLRGY